MGNSYGTSEGQAAGPTQQVPPREPGEAYVSAPGEAYVSAPDVPAEPMSLFASPAQISESWHRVSDGPCQQRRGIGKMNLFGSAV